MLNIFKYRNGMNIIPRSDGATAPNSQGDLAVSSVDGKLYYFDGTVIAAFLTGTSTETITNKTIDANSNTILNLTNTNLSGSALISNANLDVMPTLTLKGNNTGSSSTPLDLTVTQVNAMLGTSGAAVSIGSFDGQPESADGLTLTGSVLYAQSADATHPGMVNVASQTFTGTKTFSSQIIGSVSGTSLNITGIAAIANGGTGQATKSAGFDALSPMTSVGDIIIGGISGTGTRLAASTDGFILTLSSGSPVWASNTGGGGGILSIGNLDSQAVNNKGLAFVSNVLSTQSADATHPGMVNATTQTFGGAKTLTNALTFEQVSTPATPSSGFNSLYPKSDGNFYSLDSAGNEQVIGSGGGGGGENFIGLTTTWSPVNVNDRNAETSVGNWVPYANPAASTPTTMTGGSPTVSISRTTNAGQVINGNGSFKVIKDAANRQGEGASVVFNVPIAYQNEDALISIPYKIITGSVALGDLKVFIYDVTNSNLITPVNNDVVGSNGAVSATFRMPPIAGTPANLQMRVGFFFATTSTTAVTFAFDDVVVSPLNITNSFVKFAEIATPSNPPALKHDLYFKSDGNLYILNSLGQEVLVGNTGGSGANLFASSQVTINSSVITSTSFVTFDNSPAFTFTPTISGVYKVYCPIPLYSGNTTNDVVGRIFNTSANATLLYESQIGAFGTASAVFGNGLAQSIYELTAGISYVFDIQGRVFSGGSTQARGDVGSFYMFAELASNGNFGAGLAGTEWKSDLAFTLSASFGTTSNVEFLYRRIGDTMEVRGVFSSTSPTAAPAAIGLPPGYNINAAKMFGNPPGTSVGEFFNPQQTVTVLAYGAGIWEVFYDGSDTANLYLSQTGGAFAFTKQNANTFTGSGQFCVFEFAIPILGWGVGNDNANPQVSASYYASASGTTSPTQTINFDTKVYDTANSVTASAPGTGTWKFTAPVNGIYHVSGSMEFGTGHYVDIYKNGVKFANLANADTASGMGTIAWDMQLLATDYIDIRSDSPLTYGGGAITAQATACKVCITKVA